MKGIILGEDLELREVESSSDNGQTWKATNNVVHPACVLDSDSGGYNGRRRSGQVADRLGEGDNRA